MTDNTTTIEQLKNIIRQFVDDRDWEQYHSPKNLSMNISGEAAELMEIFMWVDNKQSYIELENKRTDVEYEVADIAFALLNFCMRNNIDLSKAMETKIALISQKYPIEKAKGKRLKYSEY